MSKRATIYAGTPAYRETPATLERARLSVAALDGWATFGNDAECSASYTQAAMRQEGFALAVRWGADWYLQLDADERLVNGEQLHDWLAGWEHAAWPIPYVQEDGQTTLAPFKLVRPRSLRLVAHADYFQQIGDEQVVCLSGYECELAPKLVAGMPHLLHEPSRRRNRHRRLSTVELQIEPRPADAVQWPLPANPWEAQ